MLSPVYLIPDLGAENYGCLFASGDKTFWLLTNHPLNILELILNFGNLTQSLVAKEMADHFQSC